MKQKIKELKMLAEKEKNARNLEPVGSAKWRSLNNSWNKLCNKVETLEAKE